MAVCRMVGVARTAALTAILCSLEVLGEVLLGERLHHALLRVAARGAAVQRSSVHVVVHDASNPQRPVTLAARARLERSPTEIVSQIGSRRELRIHRPKAYLSDDNVQCKVAALALYTGHRAPRDIYRIHGKVPSSAS